MKPGPPAAGDTAVVQTGTLIAVHETVGPYDLLLAARGDVFPPETVTLDAYLSTISASVHFYDYFQYDEDNTYGVGPAVINTVGLNTLTGVIDTGSNAIPHNEGDLTLYIASVLAPDGVSVLPGVLDNKGQINGDAKGSPLIYVKGSPDATLRNNGAVNATGRMTFDVPILGTGTIASTPLLYTYGAVFNKAVGSGQTVYVYGYEGFGAIRLNDPIDFRATIADFAPTSPYFKTAIDLNQSITSATFYNHVLTLKMNSTVVTELRFTNDVTAANLLIHTEVGFTRVGTTNGINYDPNVTVAAGTATPTLPPIAAAPGPTKLPNTSGSGQIQIDHGTYVAATTRLYGYTIYMGGKSASDFPTVDITNVTLGSRMDVRVSGYLDQARFGRLNAVGYNEAQYSIAAVSGGAGGVANFDIRLANVLAPDGVVVQAGVLNNTGSITGNESTVLRITGDVGSKLINAGTVITAGMMFIDPTITGTGSLTVGLRGQQAGDLELGGAVSTGQSVYLESGKLTIDDTKHFFGTIYQFDSQDRIVLKNTQVDAVRYDNGKLYLDGGSDGILHFRRPVGVTFDTASFKLGHEGRDTVITTPVLAP